jgi:hypothetical protein
MGSLNRRVKWLRDRTPSLGRVLSEEEQRHAWMVRTKQSLSERMPEAVKEVRARIREVLGDDDLGHRATMSADELIERLLDWQPKTPKAGVLPTPPRTTVECEVYRAIYHGESGTEGMIIPAEWSASFEAGQELRRRYGAVPPQTFALWLYERIKLMRAGGTTDELERLDRSHCDQVGITTTLEDLAAGPDHETIPKEEAAWRINEHMADLTQSEWAWQWKKHLDRLLDGDQVLDKEEAKNTRRFKQ